MNVRNGVGRVLLAAAILTAASCTTATDEGDDGGDNPTISIALSDGTLKIQRGANGTITVTLTRGGGFTGAASIAVEGLPTGVTASANPASIGTGSTTSTITFTASGTATTGTATVTVRATGTGVSAATATFSLEVNPAAESGGFTLAVNSNALTIVRGTQATTTVTVGRTGVFTGAVALSVSGAPTGVTATFSPASVTGTTSTLTVVVSGTATTGAFTLTITGTGSGVANQTITVALTVNPQAAGGNVTWTFCALSGIPVWFAYQDGSAAWTVVTPNASNQFIFSINSARGGVAYTMTPGNSANVTVILGTQQELGLQGAGQCGGATTGKTINGSVANVAATDLAFINMGGASATVSGAMGTTFTLMNVPDRTLDVLAGRATQTVGGTGVTLTFNAGIIRRNLNPVNNSTMPVFDFNSAEAWTPVTQNLTINNLGTDVSLITSSYFTAGGTAGTFYSETGLTAGANRTFATVPGSARMTGDLSLLTVAAIGSGQTIPQTTRSATVMSAAAGDRSVTLGPTPGAVTVTSTNSPYVQPRVQYTVQAEYNQFYYFGASSASGANGRSLFISVSAGWLGGAATLDVVMPNFSGLAGWNDVWGLFTNVLTSWVFAASGWTAAGGSGNASPYADGGASVTGQRIGSSTF